MMRSLCLAARSPEYTVSSMRANCDEAGTQVAPYAPPEAECTDVMTLDWLRGRYRLRRQSRSQGLQLMGRPSDRLRALTRKAIAIIRGRLRDKVSI